MHLPSRKTLLACTIALFWAAAMAGAYWWYQLRYIRAFSEQTTLFAGEILRLPAELAGPGPIRLVHFWDPACPCNVGNQQHLSQLLEHLEIHSDPPGVAAIPVSAFHPDGRDDHVVRFCFAKQESTLAAAGERLCRL